ncbi:MAG: tetratricopeptide repeat protein [Rhizobiaceae bacterium]
MSDDSFIREVDEELRHDQLKSMWSRYGKFVIGTAVLIVAATAGFRGWEYYTQSRAASSGDLYLQASQLAEDGKNDEAIAELEQLGQSGSGQYPALAKLRIAGEMAAKGDKPAAIEQFEAIAADNSFDGTFREIASLRAGLLSVDTEDYESVKAKLGPLAAGGQTFRSIAREALGLAALKAGALEEAANWYRQITDDADSNEAVKNRANIVLEYLAGNGVSGAG